MDALIQRLNAAGVRYLLIGGQAVRLEGMPRFSMDWDLYIPPRDLENIALINNVMEEDIDSPVLPLGGKGENFVQTYQTKWGIVQFHLGGAGLPPFDEAYDRSIFHRTETDVRVRCLSGADLLAAKQKAGRPQDQDDIRFLLKKAELGLL